MHLLLTDRLSCPRCGPEFGLILLAERLEERRVHDGSLGCPNCRDRYPVVAGRGDLRPAPRGPAPDPPDHDSDGPSAAEIGGLLGVLQGPGQLVLLGSLADRAHTLAEMIDEIEVVAATRWADLAEERDGVSRLLVSDRLPLQTMSVRGVALVESEVAIDLEEAARLLAHQARIAVFGASDHARARLETLGLDIVASDPGRVVAVR